MRGSRDADVPEMRGSERELPQGLIHVVRVQAQEDVEGLAVHCVRLDKVPHCLAERLPHDRVLVQRLGLHCLRITRLPEGQHAAQQLAQLAPHLRWRLPDELGVGGGEPSRRVPLRPQEDGVRHEHVALVVIHEAIHVHEEAAATLGP
eukprot:714027-Alexandrium_andersonii.AAC.1